MYCHISFYTADTNKTFNNINTIFDKNQLKKTRLCISIKEIYIYLNVLVIKSVKVFLGRPVFKLVVGIDKFFLSRLILELI